MGGAILTTAGSLAAPAAAGVDQAVAAAGIVEIAGAVIRVAGGTVGSRDISVLHALVGRLAPRAQGVRRTALALGEQEAVLAAIVGADLGHVSQGKRGVGDLAVAVEGGELEGGNSGGSSQDLGREADAVARTRDGQG